MKRPYSRLYAVIISMACLPVSCGTDGARHQEYAQGPYRISMEHRSDSMHMLFLDVEGVRCDSMPVPYPVYRFDCGDLTGDGIPEVCIGVTKPTRYWPVGRRLFIYHLFHGRYIRPLWMGSRVGRPLLDFTVCRDSVPARIHTEEYGPDSAIIRNEYILQGFGLQFSKRLDEPAHPFKQ